MSEAVIYNTTIKVDAAISEAWLAWLLNAYIPQLMQTNCFKTFKLVRLLDVDESDGPTYALQFSAESKADYNRYVAVHASALRQKAYDKWGEQFIAFNSVMEVIAEGAAE